MSWSIHITGHKETVDEEQRQRHQGRLEVLVEQFLNTLLDHGLGASLVTIEGQGRMATIDAANGKNRVDEI